MAYLGLYDRYVSDTLSGVRAVRTRFLEGLPADFRTAGFNQRVMSHLLLAGAEVLELPVHYYPMSPGRVPYTSAREGLRALGTIVRSRVAEPSVAHDHDESSGWEQTFEPAIAATRLRRHSRIDLAGGITTVVFDMDGVLADTSPCHATAYAALWEQVGVTGPDYAAIAGRPTVEVLQEVLAPLGLSPRELDGLVAEKQALARHAVEGSVVGYADTLSVVEQLRERQIPMAVATGASALTAEMTLKRIGLDEAFELVVTADDSRRGKPAPDIYLAAMGALGSTPMRTLIVEDSVAGIAAGLDSGAVVGCVRSGLSSRQARFVGSFPDLQSLYAKVFT